MALLGTHQLFNLSHDAVFAMVEKIVLHPDFNGKTASLGDIALIQLKTPVKFTSSIMPICLPTSENFSVEADCWITGWGKIKYGVPLPPPLTLQEVKVSLINQNDCNGIYNDFPVMGLGEDAIKDDMICAGYPNDGKDSCQGDSGGPLVCQLQGRWTQAGIVSWGIGCASKRYPGVYTSVPYYSDWIKDVMEENMNNKSNSGNVPTQNVYTPLIPIQNVSTPLVPIQNVSTSLVPIQNVSTPLVPIQNVSTPLVPIQNVSTPLVPIQNVSTPLVPIQNVSTPLVPIQNVFTLVVSSQNCELPCNENAEILSYSEY
ncbi:hypothetical protein Chor_009259 [Crotalus horridus]